MKNIFYLSMLILMAVSAGVFAFLHYRKTDGTASVNKVEKIYTIEEIRTFYGYDEMKEREEDYNGIHYTWCMPADSNYRVGCHWFYIFESEADAEDVFRHMAKNYFRNITVSEKNHVEGWIAGICDAEEMDGITLSGNVITFEMLDFYGYDEW